MFIFNCLNSKILILSWGWSIMPSLKILNNQNCEQFYLTVHRHLCKKSNTGIPNNETKSPEYAIKTKEALPMTKM